MASFTSSRWDEAPRGELRQSLATWRSKHLQQIGCARCRSERQCSGLPVGSKRRSRQRSAGSINPTARFRWRTRRSCCSRNDGARLMIATAMTSKYPQIEPKVALDALVGRTSGDEGTWFAAAKSRNQQGFHRSGRVCKDKPLRSENADAPREILQRARRNLPARSCWRHCNGCCAATATISIGRPDVSDGVSDWRQAFRWRATCSAGTWRHGRRGRTACRMHGTGLGRRRASDGGAGRKQDASARR